MVNVFAVPVFFICMRECLETSIIVSVLLSFLKQTLGSEHDPQTYKRLVKQVWSGVGAGLFICLIIGGGFIGAFYGAGQDYFAKTEDLWEGIFSLIATVIITAMGAALLRVSKLQDKWRRKLAKALEARESIKTVNKGRVKVWAEKYAMFLLPFVTVLREGLEAVVFIGGVSLGMPAESFPLAVVAGLAAGIVIGYLIYKGGNFASLQIFLVISTCFLYLVAAGLFSKAVWSLEMHRWSQLTGGDAAETGSGPGSYDIRQSVWHVNCCNPEINGGGGWGIFNSILGWQNSATYGSVISYNLYWVFVMVTFIIMRHVEKGGRVPFVKSKPTPPRDNESEPGVRDSTAFGKASAGGEGAPASTNVREIHEHGTRDSYRISSHSRLSVLTADLRQH
ncbi:High-affinity iron ion transporter [Lasiodiplodia theobromae]|uniref:Plasma membrane iron permease n=1 Tax=Lasiodiplodia theobromae TaxID=45133 RepID=A0A5N5DID5_9PEZI|nr:High-affinity iron ion transporter [Lasiodiplodia theobromae]KAB2577605.1 Plasma membrane iron permease [Lasiodiplodia theobromae]KAF4535606.1 High-affinity iron ion transporter [Lasiodiplodia theobromae]